MMVLLKMDAVGVMLTIICGGDIHTPPDGRKSNFVHSQTVGMQKLSKHLGPALHLMTITNYLMKHSVPNISKLYHIINLCLIIFRKYLQYKNAFQ